MRSRNVISVTKKQLKAKKAETFLKNNTMPTFLKRYETMTQILTDQGPAALGDAYINLAYSLALSNKKGKPCGRKSKDPLSLKL